MVLHQHSSMFPSWCLFWFSFLITLFAVRPVYKAFITGALLNQVPWNWNKLHLLWPITAEQIFQATNQNSTPISWSRRRLSAGKHAGKSLLVSNTLLIEGRSVTSRYHGGTISGWQQTQRRLRRQGERQKNNMSILTNNNFARASRHFVHFLLPLLQHYDMKLPNFTSPLYGVDEHNTKIVAFFF